MFRHGFLLLLLTTCCSYLLADKTTSRQKRVVGGTHYDKGDFPFLVSLWYKGTNSPNRKSSPGFLHYCGGALVGERWVLTSGHCFDNTVVPGLNHKPSWEVYLGVHAQTKAETEAQKNEIETICKPPEYNIKVIYGDLALVKLKTPATLKNGVVSLADFNTDDDCPTLGQDVKIIGWGKTLTKNISDIPNVATVQVSSTNECSEEYSKPEVRKVFGLEPGSKDLQIDSKTLCAGVPEGGIDACTADSGGPLLASCGGKDNVVVGTVSYGYKCATTTPSVYTRVSAYKEWIAATMTDGC